MRVCNMCQKPRWARIRRDRSHIATCLPCRWKAGDRPAKVHHPRRIKHKSFVPQPTGDKPKKKKGKK